MSLEEDILSQVLAQVQQPQQPQQQMPMDQGWQNPQPVGSWSNRPSMEIVPNTPENSAYQQQQRDILNPAGQESYASLSAKATVDQFMQAQADAQKKQQLELMKAVSGLDPQLQAVVLKRAGIQVPDMQSKEARTAEAQKQQLLLKHRLEAPDRAAQLDLKRQDLEDKQAGRESQRSMQDQILELRKQSVLAQQATQLQKMQEMLALIPQADPRRKALEEMILSTTMNLLPQLLATQSGDQAPNVGELQVPTAPLQGPKITVRRKAAVK